MIRSGGRPGSRRISTRSTSDDRVISRPSASKSARTYTSALQPRARVFIGVSFTGCTCTPPPPVIASTCARTLSPAGANPTRAVTQTRAGTGAPSRVAGANVARDAAACTMPRSVSGTASAVSTAATRPSAPMSSRTE